MSRVDVSVGIDTQSYYDAGYSAGQTTGIAEGIAEQKAKHSFAELSKIDSEILSSKAKDTASLVFPTNRQLEAILKKQPKYSSEIISSIVKSKVIYEELIKSIKKYMENLK